MNVNKNHNNGSRGAIFAIALVIFLISLFLAGGLRFWLWYQTTNAKEETGAQDEVDKAVIAELLMPRFVVGGGLESQALELTEKLFEPMRQYYATKDERMGDVSIEKSDDVEHSSEVSFFLETNEGSIKKKFFYDRGGEERDGDWLKWEPSMLDNEI